MSCLHLDRRDAGGGEPDEPPRRRRWHWMGVLVVAGIFLLGLIFLIGLFIGRNLWRSG